jgi:hypothetical protein
MQVLSEHLTFDEAKVVVESSNEGKDLYMKGICIQGNVKNANQRVYPTFEINKAVSKISDQIAGGTSVLGEVDHPEDLKINLDRVSHMLTSMWMDGHNGYGKLKILPTPMGKLVETMLQSGVKLGVSSRGTGNVTGDGKVSDFEMVTVDIVANPSAPDAYPTPLVEQIMQGNRSNILLDVAKATNHDDAAQKYLQEEVLKFITNLDIRRTK